MAVENFVYELKELLEQFLVESQKLSEIEGVTLIRVSKKIMKAEGVKIIGRKVFIRIPFRLRARLKSMEKELKKNNLTLHSEHPFSIHPSEGIIRVWLHGEPTIIDKLARKMDHIEKYKVIY